ncbi:hypothetical protein AAHK14_08620 [Moraxella sp. K1664]|uniref:Uncharacterized protein n=1 Tax=Moraxella lacunata TaxID=477 RepID=A0A1B8PX59_MORLA|nr:hypothetical protein [Moraxella lacunata]OBX59549.1 hypothetical protein A9Z63_10770 [Moraxella lacunata]OBX60507.1 hypothetical protein A9309_09490 [Moraxella lacunata]
MIILNKFTQKVNAWWVFFWWWSKKYAKLGFLLALNLPVGGKTIMGRHGSPQTEKPLLCFEWNLP